MLRIFALSSIVLLYLAATQCVAVEKKEAFFCDEKTCDADCRRKYFMSKVDAYGKCDESNLCHCYRRNSCNETICETLCKERVGREPNMHSNCTVGRCYCSYDKRCVEAECARACEQRYSEVDLLESFCSDTMCICKWMEKSGKRRSGGGTEAPSGEAKEAAEQLRGYHVFPQDEEDGEEAAVRGEEKPLKLADSGS